jgi:hypothetical protein
LPTTPQKYSRIDDLDEKIGALETLLLDKKNYNAMAWGDGACLGGCCAGRPNATASMLVCGAWAVMAGVWTLAWLMPQRWCRPSALYRCSSGKPWSAAMNYRMRSLICSPSDRRWPASKGLHERVAVHSGLPQNAGKGADGNASAPTRTLITVSSIAWSQPVRSTSGRWR